MRIGVVILGVVLAIAGWVEVAEAKRVVLGAISGWPISKGGDVLAFGSDEVRIHGIAVPNIDDPGGPEAASALAKLVAGRLVDCAAVATTASDRPAAVCVVKNCKEVEGRSDVRRVCEEGGEDIAELLVAGGFARDCFWYSGQRYAAAEKQARANGHDLSAIFPLPRYCFPH